MVIMKMNTKKILQDPEMIIQQLLIQALKQNVAIVAVAVVAVAAYVTTSSALSFWLQNIALRQPQCL